MRKAPHYDPEQIGVCTQCHKESADGSVVALAGMPGVWYHICSLDCAALPDGIAAGTRAQMHDAEVAYTGLVEINE